MNTSKLKRKGVPWSGPPTKRTNSGQVTPQSRDSDGDYHSERASTSEDLDSDFSGDEKVRKAQAKLSLDAYNRRQQPRKQDKAATNTSQAGGVLKQNLSQLPLKRDHLSRPMWLDTSKGTIILESFSHLAAAAQDFLITVAEPQSRPSFVHEYKITDQSLLSASSIGMTYSDIIKNLEKFSKSPLPAYFKDWIREVTQAFGKVKLVLKHNRYYVESSDAPALQRLLKDPDIGSCRLEGTDEHKKEKASTMGGLVIPGTKDATSTKAAEQQSAEQQQQQQLEYAEDEEGLNDDDFTALLRAEDDDDDNLEQVHSFQVAPSDVEKVKSRCIDIKLPITEEYDFRNDERNANLDIDLRPAARIRD